MSSTAWRETLHLLSWSFTKVPLLFFVRPSVVRLNDRECVIRIRLRRRTKNHLGSMYFAALCAGADCAGGLMAMRAIEAGGVPVSLIFADFTAEFLRRAEGDVHFVNHQGELVHALVQRAIDSGDRVSEPLTITAYVPSISETDPVAKFTVTLSLKKKGKR